MVYPSSMPPFHDAHTFVHCPSFHDAHPLRPLPSNSMTASTINRVAGAPPSTHHPIPSPSPLFEREGSGVSLSPLFEREGSGVSLLPSLTGGVGGGSSTDRPRSFKNKCPLRYRTPLRRDFHATAYGRAALLRVRSALVPFYRHRRANKRMQICRR